ncbi:hypothetical protein [Desulfosporosinus meridiei]|uniref:Uracil DNA glycosylase superfamily protein n=1 Tax=Desulfosporosinus meridiei (strain ATCC BAA-275 / DSM 13257 / KCTC 12902 / NCIMB 13706 / S10) TaxID=768704 RepID=J7IPW0_DESMD|nr:hypothetical protein [Desulfosporosinus meridiei]AFQ43675.1 hypothetical protein Desmer_1701 [Desulfosporosinus meridiei DSM 13257]
MSGLARDKYMPLVDRDSGDRTYPIWLLINPKYPAVINGIWRHVLDEMQDKVYRELQSRIDTKNIYIRSVVGDCGIVPNTLNWWGKEVASEIKILREIIEEYEPKILITFGGFPYEFIRRVFSAKPEKGPKYWSALNLKNEFEKAIANFDLSQTNVVPLLRRVNTSDKDQEAQKYLDSTIKEQYFSHVGRKLSETIIQNKDSLEIWIR